MPTGVYYDLPSPPSTAQPNGPKVFGYDDEVQARFFSQEFIQDGGSYSPLAWNTTETVGSITYYLVEETAPDDLGGGMVSWKRTYYELPPDRSEYENIAYNYNLRFIKDADTGLWIFFAEGVQFALQVATRVDYKYYATANPAADVPTNLGFRVFKVGNAVCSQGTDPVSGTVPDLTITSPYLGDDSEVARWKGNIWVRRERYVPFPTIDAEFLT